MRNTGPPPVAPLNSTLFDALTSDFSHFPKVQVKVEFAAPIREVSKDRLINQRLPRFASKFSNGGCEADGDVSVSWTHASDPILSSLSDPSSLASNAGSRGGIFATVGVWGGEQPPVPQAA